MANTIALRKAYSTMLDEVYKLASLTAVLDGPNDLVKEGANANEILIPKMSMQGLANYNKQTGYVAGDVTLEYETKKCTYDRGRMFTVDAMDNIESAGVAFGRLSGEFLRTQVVPELDAWRLASYIVTVDVFTADDKKRAIARKRTWSVIPDTSGDGTDALIYSGSFAAASEITKGYVTLDDKMETCTFTEGAIPSE